VLQELQAKPTTRAQDILSWVPDYWAHYIEQGQQDDPQLDPARSRGGIFELELALDAIDAYYNDLGLVLPVNTPNVGGALAGFDEDVVVEVFARVDKDGVHPEPTPALPRHLAGLIGQLAEYQYLTADAAWSGSRRDAVRALSSHPWLTEIRLAEVLYDEMAAAHQAWLPERLLR
jgi:6-phospho-beta-glucosidase